MIQPQKFPIDFSICDVTIIHRHVILEYDGLDSTDDFPEIIIEHFFVISPDLQHDHNFTCPILISGYFATKSK
jgi:hypothetical protein